MDLWPLALVDQHAHPMPEDAHVRRHFLRAFTESHDSEVVDCHTPTSLFFRRSIRDIAELLQCEADKEVLSTQREKLGLDALTVLCFTAARLETVLLDDGLGGDRCNPVSWHTSFVDAKRVLRLETLAQDLFPLADSFADYVDRFRGEIAPPPQGVVALKSIAAYRSGLAIQAVGPEEAARRFRALKSEFAGAEFRLADKVLVNFLFLQALEVAATYSLPVQLHTGFGDTDLDLRLSNPLHLRAVLEDPRFRSVSFVLLHASYPYVREAGYLASVYPGVYVDYGLAIPYLSVQGMRRVISELLELAPPSKILYSSDAHGIPELFYLGAKWGREVLGLVLDECVHDGDLNAKEAEDVAAAILRENARTLYRLHDVTRGPLLRQ